MFLGWIIGGSIFFSPDAVLVFLVLCAITLCLGHSLGMHRKLIHTSFCSPKWLERMMVYLGTLVGLGGPFTMMRNHDMRDWAQRQSDCHPFLSHQSGLLKDLWWQLHCTLKLENGPAYTIPAHVAGDPFYRFLQATSMSQQLPLAALLYAAGGWGWVFWGICGRVCISIFGHWIIGYCAHNHGHRDWHIANAAIQGHNVRHFGLITFGECWHNNHHAFPGSAKLGLNDDQFDPGWLVLKVLKRLGLVWNLETPETLSHRPELRRHVTRPLPTGHCFPGTLSNQLSTPRQAKSQR